MCVAYSNVVHAYCGSQPTCGNASISSIAINATSSTSVGGLAAILLPIHLSFRLVRCSNVTLPYRVPLVLLAITI